MNTHRRNPEHLSEETLHMYLDGELAAADVARVEDHLAACESCRSEVEGMLRLFSALDELAPAPAPDLVPGVLARVRPGPGPVDLRSAWLTPVLQGAIALALIAWSGVWLARTWRSVDDLPWLDRTTQAWAHTEAWAATQLAAVQTWPGSFWTGLREWAGRVSLSGHWSPSLPLLIGLGGALIAFWLVGNVMVLHRSLTNGQTSS